MANLQAVVVLHVLSLTDPFPSRSLTFSKITDRVEVGRASKRENKNLAPSPHNALFDSRVMSRTHAILRVSQDKKIVYICDPGSMHGTWLNKKKIPLDKEIVLSDGDELTFGVEVIRGTDTFPPLAVRCECQWLEASHVPPLPIEKSLWDNKVGTQKVCSLSASNTFCVPDDDEDEDEEEDVEAPVTATAVDLTTEPSSESNASDALSESEDSRSVVEVQSPMTSPLQNDNSKRVHNRGSSPIPLHEAIMNSVNPSNERDEGTEQPLATPRLTPPSTNFQSEETGADSQYYDDYFAHSSDEESNVDVEAEDWDIDEEEDEDGEKEFEKEDVIEEEEQNEATLSNVAQATCEPDQVSTKHYRAWGLDNGVPTGEEVPVVTTRISMSNYAPAPSNIQASAPNDSLSATKLPSNDSQQRERSMPCTDSIGPMYPQFPRPEPHSYLLSSAKLSEPFQPYLGSPTFLPPIIQKPQPSSSYALPLQSPFSSTVPYNDGPFATGQVASISASRTNTASDNSKHDFIPFMDPLAPMIPRTSCDASPSEIAATRTLPDWKPQNVNKAPHLAFNLCSGTKRKAAEMESEPADDDPPLSPPEVHGLANEDNDLPNAQPQPTVTVSERSDSQLTAVSLTEVLEEAKDVERPVKQVKTSHRGSFRSHAATAIVGAVVGAVGTIAALASLPPDYFA